MAKKANNDTTQEAGSKIEAIKQLIFGENMVQYDSEFDTLKADLLKKREELKQIIEDTRLELSQNIDSLATDLNIRITDLENSTEDKLEAMDDKKLSRKAFGEMLIELGSKISE